MNTYVVFGAAKPGIGQAITKRLRTDGKSVLGTYAAEHTDEAAKLSASDPGLELVALDHASSASLSAFFDRAPSLIGGVVVAQMHFDIRNAFEFDEGEWARGLAENVTLPHLAAVKLGPRVVSGGSVVTVTSTEGFIGSFGAAGYAAGKAAVHNLVKTHANVLGAKGVRVNAVAAGWIGGVMDTDEVFSMSRRITPLGRLGSPEEIAGVVAFLLGPDASFVTGSTIIADGGYTCVDAIAKYEYDAMKSNSE